MANAFTLAELVTECDRALKQYKGAKDDLIKHMINMVYLQELIPLDDLYPLYWLVDFDDTRASVAPSVITAITIANPGVITCDAVHNLVVDDIVSIYSIVGTTQLNARTYGVATVPTTSTLTLKDLTTGTAIDTTSMTAWSSGGVVNHRGITLNTTGKNVQKILKCAWYDEAQMKEIMWPELEEVTRWWDVGPARPERYFHRKQYVSSGGTLTEQNILMWFQNADQAYDLRYWFEARVDKLEADTDIPLLPPEFHYCIVAGVMQKLAEVNLQVEAPQIWPGIYQQSKAALLRFNRTFWSQNQGDRQKKPFLQ